MARTVWNVGICPRRGCDKTITVVFDDEAAFVLHHKCKGKPYTIKENK
jgi:hypothetical protein